MWESLRGGRPSQCECVTCFQSELSSSPGVNAIQMLWSDCVSWLRLLPLSLPSAQVSQTGRQAERVEHSWKWHLRQVLSLHQEHQTRGQRRWAAHICAIYTHRRTHTRSQQNKMKKIKYDSHFYIPPLGSSRVQYLRLCFDSYILLCCHLVRLSPHNIASVLTCVSVCDSVFSPWERFEQGPEEAGRLPEQPLARWDRCRQHGRGEGLQPMLPWRKRAHSCRLQPAA